MSNYNEDEQEFVHFYSENGTNTKNDKQQEKMKPLTAFVQIGLDGTANGQEVKLSLNCWTVANHAAFLLGKINESQGNLIGLQLNGPVELASVLEGNVALMDHNVPLEVNCKYTFRFKLAKVQEEDGPDPVEELSKQMAQLAMEKEELKKFVDAKVAQLVEKQNKQKCKMDELEKEKNTLKEIVDELIREREKRQKMLKEEEKMKVEEEKRMASAEYARLIGVPNVTSLEAHYNREKLLQMIEHGNSICSIYIQENQELEEEGIPQSIVDLLATAEKPEKMVGQVTIESCRAWFDWPKRDELKLKCKTSNVAYTYNEASASPETHSDCYLAEYELTNGGCRFQVLVHYWQKSNYNKSVAKLVYRRLP